MSRFSPAVWLGVIDLPHALPFAMLQGLLGLCFILPAAVIPIEALSLLGDARNVSVLFFGISFAGLAGAFFLPWLVHVLGRRAIVVTGGVLVAISSGLISLDEPLWLIAGTAVRVFGFLCLDIVFEIAIMERIPRRAFARFEPVRMFFLGIGFVVGPWFGVWLSLHAGFWSPFALVAVLTAVLCAALLYSGLVDHPRGVPRLGRPPNPLRFVPRFARQPRLRLAWVLSLGRSSWWVMFFIYAPIYCVQSGLGEELAGIILSASAAAMLLTPLWGRLGARIGLRTLLAIGYAATGVATVAVAAAAGAPWLAVALLLASSVLASVIDAAGNGLFLRAVHPHERTEMASVFATYREIAQLGPPGIFAALLSVFALPVVFVVSGAGMMVFTVLTRYIPRRY